MTIRKRVGQGGKSTAGGPRKPDKAIRAAAALDRAASRYAAIFDVWCLFVGCFDPDGVADWDDDMVIVQGVLGHRAGPALARLADLRGNMLFAQKEDERTFAELIAIKPTSAKGEAFYRAAVARYARRSTGDPMDEELALRALRGERVLA